MSRFIPKTFSAYLPVEPFYVFFKARCRKVPRTYYCAIYAVHDNIIYFSFLGTSPVFPTKGDCVTVSSCSFSADTFHYAGKSFHFSPSFNDLIELENNYSFIRSLYDEL